MATATIQEELEILEPAVKQRDWVLSDSFASPDGQEATTRTYTQKPLSFMRKIELMSLLGDAVDKLSDNGKPLNLAVMFDGEATVDNFVAILSRVAAEIPEFLEEAFCLFLNVPKNERPWAKWVLENTLTDDEGFELIELFVDQNAEGLKSFFGEKGQSLLSRVTKKFGLDAVAPSSKPAKRTRQSTQ